MPRAPEFIPCVNTALTRQYMRDEEARQDRAEQAFERARDLFRECVRIGHDLDLPKFRQLPAPAYPLSSYLGESSPECQRLLLVACAWAMRDQPGQCIQALRDFVDAAAAEYAEDVA